MCIRDRSKEAALEAHHQQTQLLVKEANGEHTEVNVMPVSYTHLDVYKRQVHVDVHEVEQVLLVGGRDGIDGFVGISHGVQELSLIHI